MYFTVWLLRTDHCLPIQNLRNRFTINLVFYSDYCALSEKIVSCFSWKVYIYKLYCIPWSVRLLDSCHQRPFSLRRLPFFHWVISYFFFHILEAASSCSTAMHPSCLTSRCPCEVWEKAGERSWRGVQKARRRGESLSVTSQLAVESRIDRAEKN